MKNTVIMYYISCWSLVLQRVDYALGGKTFKLFNYKEHKLTPAFVIGLRRKINAGQVYTRVGHN
jgi:hypothetical protein